MPHISRGNQQTLETFTCMKEDTAGFYMVNTDDGGYYPYHQVLEYTDLFFNDLKILLDEAATNGLDVVCDETDKSFTLFGQKFYCFCIESSYAANNGVKNARYSIVPILYKENYITNSDINIYEGGTTSGGNYRHTRTVTDADTAITKAATEANGFVRGGVPKSGTYHTNTCLRAFNRYLHDYHINYTANAMSGECYNAYYSGSNNGAYTGYGEMYNYMGFNQLASLCVEYNTRNVIRYKINIYYNETCLYITYKSYNDNFVEEYPLGFFAKGTDIFKNEIMLTTLTPALCTTGNQANYNSPSYHTTIDRLLERITIWSLETGQILFDQDTGYTNTFNVLKNPFINGYKFIDNTKFLRIKLQALDGLITFENLIIGEIDKRIFEFSRGEFYTIEDETYYIPTDVSINALYPDKATQNYIFMKM